MTSLWETCGRFVDEVAKTSRRVSTLFMPIVEQEAPIQEGLDVSSPTYTSRSSTPSRYGSNFDNRSVSSLSSRSSTPSQYDSDIDNRSVSSLTSVSSCGNYVAKPKSGLRSYGSYVKPQPNPSGTVVLYSDPDQSEAFYDATEPIRACIPYQPTHSGTIVKSGGTREVIRSGSTPRPPNRNTSTRDRRTNFGHSRPSTKNTSRLTIEGSQRLAIEDSQRLTIEHSQRLTVEGSQSLSIEGFKRLSIEGSQRLSIEVSQRLSITSNNNIRKSNTDKLDTDVSAKKTKKSNTNPRERAFDFSNMADEDYEKSDELNGTREFYMKHSAGERVVVSFGPPECRKYRIYPLSSCKVPAPEKEVRKYDDSFARKPSKRFLKPHEKVEILGVAFSCKKNEGPEVLDPETASGKRKRIWIRLRWPDGEISWESRVQAREFIKISHPAYNPDAAIYKAAKHFEELADEQDY